MAAANTSLSVQLRRVQLPVLRRLSELLGGDYSNLRFGGSDEFSHMKEYVPGDDDTRRINWNALAADPYNPRVNVMHPDSSVVGWVIADCGPNMNFGSALARKSTASLEAAAVFGHLLTRRGNKYGAILLGNQQMETVNLSQRRNQVAIVAGRQSQIAVPDGAATDLSAGLQRFRTLQKRRGVCVVISDFRSSAWESELKLIAMKHTLYLVQVVDPLELGMDGDFGLNNLIAPSSFRRSRVDITEEVAKEYTKLAQTAQDGIRQKLVSTGGKLIELHTDEDWLRMLVLALKQPKRRTYVRTA